MYENILPNGNEDLGGSGCISMGLLCREGWQAAGAKLVARLMGITGGVLGSLFSTSKSSVRPPPKNLASRRALRGSTLV
jgi:hypothetical protein